MNDMSQVPVAALAIGLTEFIDEFGDELLDSLNRSNPPVMPATPTKLVIG